MNRWFWTLVLVALPLPFGSSVQASLVRDVALESACDGNVEIAVHLGMGVAIDLTQSGHTVQRAWIGDPSKLTLDTDSPIEQGATSVVYLRAIHELNFDGLPSTDTTVLTMRLLGNEGPMVCQFPISYASGTPDYTNIRLNNNSSGSERASLTALAIPSTLLLYHVEAGININANALGEDSPVVERVNRFISQVRDGQSQRSAAQELEIEWSLLVELEKQGAAAQDPYESLSS